MNNAIFLIVCLLLPLLMTIFGTCRARDTIQKSAFFSMLAVVIANGAMSAAALVLGSRLTQYELLLINAIVSSGMAFFVCPCVRERRFHHVQMLKAMCAVGVSVAVYSILTIGQTYIHGDTATASLLTKAQVEHRSLFPESWYYANGDIWVITVQTFVAPFAILMKNQSLARMLGSGLLLIVAVIAMLYHSKQILKDDSWVIAVPVFVLFLMGVADMILYQAAYTPLIIWFSVCPYLFFRVQENKRDWKAYALLGLATILMIMGGNRMLAELVAPLWGTYIVLTYLRIRNQEEIDWKTELQEVVRISASILLPALIGLVIFHSLRNTHHMMDTQQNVLMFVDSIDACVENVLGYLANLFACFGFTGGISLLTLDGILNMVLVLMCLIIVFVVPVLQALRLKEESAYVQFFYAFAVVHNLIIFVLAVLITGKQEDRHLLTSVFLWILLAARYIYVYWIRQEHFEKFIWSGLFAVAVLIASLSLAMDSRDWDDKLDARKEVSRQMAEQGFTKGYADFRTAYGQEVYSDFEIRFGGLYTDEGVPCAHYWLVEEDAFDVQNIPTFLMLTEQENREKAPSLLEYFDEPVEHMLISGYHIYVFDYDIAADLQRYIP